MPRAMPSPSVDLAEIGETEALRVPDLVGLSISGAVRPLKWPRTAMPLAQRQRGPYPGQVRPFFEHLRHVGSDLSQRILRLTWKPAHN